ncbi:MAG: neuraminidase-like domain-containing protein [Flavobacteriales bacterium]
MNKPDLIRLEKLARLSPKQIAEQDPDLYAKLNERAGISLKNNVNERLKEAPDEVKAGLGKIDFSAAKLGTQDVKEVLSKNLLKGLTAAKKKELEEVVARIPELGKIEDLVQPDLPLIMNPVFQADLAKARMYRLSDIAGLSQVKTDKALVKEVNINAISSENLDGLVKSKVLSGDEARELGLASNLYTFFDLGFELTEFVKKNQAPKEMQDLVKIDRAGWTKMIRESKMELPEGLKAEEYAEILYKKAETLFPEASLNQRLGKPDLKALLRELEILKPLFEQNEKRFGTVPFEELNTKGIKEAELEKMKSSYEKLLRLIRKYPGLRLEELFNGKGSPDEIGKELLGRTELMERFLKNNPYVNYLSLSYTHDSEDLKQLNFDGFDEKEKGMVLQSVRSYQRIYSFTEDVENLETILGAGYHSSYHITSVTLPEFIASTNLKPEVAERYYENAHMSIIRTTVVMGSILDLLTGSFEWTGVGNINPSIKNYLRDIPGYQDLFGELAFCECEHCQSIYSPAAYFVDLMQFTERYVISKHFAGTNKDHVLNLKVRRPDLWTLPLTCDNTNTLVPYLDIINEILESYIAKKKGFAGDLNDRSAVEEFVYKGEIAIEKANWKNFVYAFTQPFHLPLESVATYLGHFEKTRADIAVLLGKPQADVSRAVLHVSDKEFQLITQPDVTPAFLKRVYDVAFELDGGKIKPFNAQLLLKPMGVNRKELGRLVKTAFISAGGTDNVIIQGEKTDSDSIQNDVERIRNLSWEVLDRMHRFVRLWRKTSWNIEELDALLSLLTEKGISDGIEADTLTALGGIIQQQGNWKLSIEEWYAMMYSVPQKAFKSGAKPMFDELFNHDDVVAAEGSYPKNSVKLIHPALIIDRSTANAEFSSARLMAGLNRSDDEILGLLRFLEQPLGITDIDSATEADRGFLLTAGNISLLYRHSALAALLNLPLNDLFRLLHLVPGLASGYVQTAAELAEVITFYRWLKSTVFSLDDLHFILETGDATAAANYKTPEEVALAVISQVQGSSALLFADTVFTRIDGITETQSRDIVAANTAVLEAAPDGVYYRLKTDFDPAAAITVPAGIGTAETELRALLTQYHPQYLLPFYMSAQLSLSAESTATILTALGADLDDDAFVNELQGNTTPPAAITALAAKLLPLSATFKNRKFSAEVITYILANLAVFGITDIDQLTVTTVERLASFEKYIVIAEDGSSNIAQLADVLGAFVPATQYRTADARKLAAVLQTRPELLGAVHNVVVSASNAIEALDHYRDFCEVCAYIGISADVLPDIVSSDYVKLNAATQAILAAFRSKYKTESERKDKLEKYQDALRGKKRASLTTYLIHSGFPQFENENDLFHYFLIDTELEGCARTSRLVAATMSLQLYIHRILLNLEQDDKEPGTPGRIHVKADDLPADEWEWRRNYRVWEANRKVFLYPENYIEPELRDDKSPLFEELENELLQREINADTVLEAYAKYMRGFDEVAHLKIAGSYHEKDEKTETDVLHLLGVTADDPSVYYYRRVENIYYAEKNDNRGVVWGSWKKINVQIPVRKVAPIVYNGRLHLFWVRITTLANTVFDNNRSIFTGYSHKFSIEFTTLKLDGTWTPTQKLNLKNVYPFQGNGVLQDPLAEDAERSSFQSALGEILRSFPFFNWNSAWDSVRDAIEKLKTPRYALNPHYVAIDEYTLEGYLWDEVYPAIDKNNRLVITGAGYQLRGTIDFYNLSLQNSGVQYSEEVSYEDPAMETIAFAYNKPGKIMVRKSNSLYRTESPAVQLFDNYAYGSLIVNTNKNNGILKRHWAPCTLDNSFDVASGEELLRMPAGSKVQVVNGAYGDAILDAKGDLLFMQGTASDENAYLLHRMGTTLSETLTRTLFTSGVETTLSIETQKALKEAPVPVTVVGAQVQNLVVKDKIDFNGAYGNYYREIFFHIPFLLANHLNSQGKYAEAQKWYHYIFNPSASEVIDFSDPGLTPAQKKKMELDRNWQYLEFREIDTQKLRDQLNDKQAIETYKKDPFNPHAIARLRMSAYQKCIVMKYIDNLLDWGDQLFTQDTMESVNEATLLYIIAREILGGRPAEIGSCGEGKVNPKTYEKIQPLLDKGSEFLAELESYTIVRTPSKKVAPRPFTHGFVENSTIRNSARKAMKKETMTESARVYMAVAEGYGSNFRDAREIEETLNKNMPQVVVREVDDKFTGAFSTGTVRGLEWKRDSIYTANKFRIPSFGWSILRHVSPVFCVPGNKDLLAYYDRVDDRLFKIRNCMDIQGQKRQLALFAPEIDPRMLVRAKAAGLSLDDILNSISGNLPPYRFAYLLERAKAFTSVVQSFGSSLLSALEKKSGEELSLLRMSQQQEIMNMSSKSRRLEIDSANEGIKALNDRMESITYQIGYYDMLIAERINNWELAQSVGRHGASIIRGTEAAIGTVAGALSLIPQVGSPFAMKYGGAELGSSMSAFAFAMGSLATLGDNIAASAGLEAGFERRGEGWKHQKKMLEIELKQTQKNLLASEIRRDILIESEKIHQRNMEHNQDVMDFYGEKFSNLGLYTWLSATMQRQFREAYNNALAIARLAEQAYRYEKDETTVFIENNYFESSRAGLLAGERLLMALQTMERKYMETNYRKKEIDQAFSLTQIDPAALLMLKRTGSCDFEIPELFFDLFYPGQYRRKIQAVRLTIPCVTGPYTNISASLALSGSRIRMEAKLGASELKEVPKSRTTIIATSSAQNDAGVFQLNFKDERYMPFEGAGAVSSWKLSLPKNFRQFDYSTINDVIVHISYTAEYDELFRDKVEAGNEAMEGTLLHILKNKNLSRTFSLRQEFSGDFHRLTEQPVNQPVSVKIQNKHFPLFMNGQNLKVTKSRLILVTAAGQSVSNVKITVNGAEQSGFTKDPDFGDLYSKDMGSLLQSGILKDHILTVTAAGSLAPDSPPPHNPAIDTAKLEDIILYVEYKIG